jgi:hypothetical protein
LSGANLRGADLSCANLSGANLSSADLCGANLSSAALPENFKIARLDFGGWSICITPQQTSIGCQTHENKKWLSWTPEDVADFDKNAYAYWSKHKEAICAVIRDVMS